jgi:tetratricopeptide (TPR) repeat protein
VVEGSARTVADRVVLNVQLLRAGDQTHLWARTYDAELREVFSLVGGIAEAMMPHLDITVAPDKLHAAAKPTEDLPAYSLDLLGRYHLYRATPVDMAKAKQCFEDAIKRDPHFALAYDSLAEVYWYCGFFGFVPPRDACSAGIYHALRALEIDGTLAETHALVGQYRKELDYSWAEVQREMERALELNPASPLVRTRYALSCFLPHGRMQEAAAELERALESDPLSPFIRIWLGSVLWLARQYDRAIEQARILLEVDPAGYASHFAAGLFYGAKRMFDEAIAAHRKAVELSGGSPLMLGWLGLTLSQSGNTEEARAILGRLQVIAREVYVPPTSFAWIHLGLGELNEAFTWMDRAVDGRDPMMMPIKTFPFLDPVRTDPRYIPLLRKMNLEP